MEQVYRLTSDRGAEVIGGAHLGQAVDLSSIGGKVCQIGALDGFEFTAPAIPLMLKDVTDLWDRHRQPHRAGTARPGRGPHPDQVRGGLVLSAGRATGRARPRRVRQGCRHDGGLILDRRAKQAAWPLVLNRLLRPFVSSQCVIRTLRSLQRGAVDERPVVEGGKGFA